MEIHVTPLGNKKSAKTDIQKQNNITYKQIYLFIF